MTTPEKPSKVRLILEQVASSPDGTHTYLTHRTVVVESVELRELLEAGPFAYSSRWHIVGGEVDD